VFISQQGMVQRTSVRGINRYGRTSQGVRVMNLREGDEVSAVALVVESDTPVAVVDGVGDALADPALAGTDIDATPIEPGIDDDGVLAPPEIDSADMPDSDVEE
jgi:DNA gyrase subunit A